MLLLLRKCRNLNHILAIRILSSRAGCHVDQVGIKATTTEWLGFEGREEGIAAQASVLIIKQWFNNGILNAGLNHLIFAANVTGYVWTNPRL